MKNPWDRWHLFPPDGPEPRSGDTIEVEHEDRYTNVPGSRRVAALSWDRDQPNGGIEKTHALLRWRHTDRLVAEEWEAWYEEGEREARERREARQDEQ